jgi:hypothetical protein
VDIEAIRQIADELELEASAYEGDFADTVNGCADALRHLIDNQAASPASAPEAAQSEQQQAHGDDLPMHHDPALVEAYNKGFEAAHALQPAAPGEWHRFDMDDKPDAARRLDVALINGVTEYDRDYSVIDWTQVHDWRYAAPTAGAAPAESKDRRILLDTVGDLAEALLKVRDWVSSNPEAVSYINKAIACAGIRSSAGAATTSEDARDAEALQAEVARLTALINSPEIADYTKGVQLEASHQRERWGTSHDGGKEPADWFWLVGYLAGKALKAHIDGNSEKALHHTISTSAALCNWHAAILGKTDMRPGIAPPDAAMRAIQQEGGK